MARLLGLAVPAIVVEDLGFRDALARGRRLGTADFVHALGSLAALVIVIGIADADALALLQSQSDDRPAGRAAWPTWS